MRPPPSALPDEGICWEASGGRFETHRCRAPPAVASQAASESPPEGGWVKGAARGGRLLVAPTGPNSSGPGSYGHHSSVYVYTVSTLRSDHFRLRDQVMQPTAVFAMDSQKQRDQHNVERQH